MPTHHRPITMAEAIAARKAARAPKVHEVPPPQTVKDRAEHIAKDIVKVRRFADEIQHMAGGVDKMRRADLDALAAAIHGMDEAIKAVRKGMI